MSKTKLLFIQDSIACRMLPAGGPAGLLSPKRRNRNCPNFAHIISARIRGRKRAADFLTFS
ncbi:MAG: hypothetical protein BWY35_01312 [Firmicutes bacterium ADurb.Bin248]|nr:MAG: hypothetical protein BWY35_01312 [Firmicutes bacterium ADurb.Bin248]